MSFFGSGQSAKFVQGKLTDSKTDKPVDDVELTIHTIDSSKTYQVQTNVEGIFKFKNIADSIRFSKRSRKWLATALSN